MSLEWGLPRLAHDRAMMWAERGRVGDIACSGPGQHVTYSFCSLTYCVDEGLALMACRHRRGHESNLPCASLLTLQPYGLIRAVLCSGSSRGTDPELHTEIHQRKHVKHLCPSWLSPRRLLWGNCLPLHHPIQFLHFQDDISDEFIFTSS